MEKLKQNKGITLIALIITIIVMLLLVGVTISVALNGGLFGKAEKASYQTNVSTIKEQLALKKAEIIAEANGKQPESYTIPLSDLAISDNLALEFSDKLIISSKGELCYKEGLTQEEQTWLKEIGIEEYVEPVEDPPILELEQIDTGTYTDHTLIGLNITTQSEEQEEKIITVALQELYNNNLSLEENLLKWYNGYQGYEEGDVDAYKEIEDTGMNFDELYEEFRDDTESISEVIMYCGTISITKNNNSTEVIPYGEIYNSSKELEGIYWYHTLGNLKCRGYCYSATQLGTYKITITLGNYVLTDTITIEQF